MKQALDRGFAGMLLVMLAYMTLSVLGFFNGLCLPGLGIIALVLYGMRKDLDNEPSNSIRG